MTRSGCSALGDEPQHELASLGSPPHPPLVALPDSSAGPMSATGASLRAMFESEDNTWALRANLVARRARLIGQVLGPSAAPRLLVDLGCGPGDNTQELASYFPTANVVGLDWATRALTAARGRGVTGVQGSLEGGLPIRDDAADLVTLCEVIEHVVEPDECLSEARRILRPDGVLLMTTPNLAAWFNRFLLGVGVQPVFSEVSTRAIYGRPGTEVVGHLRLFTKRALAEFVADSGFRDVSISGGTYHDVPRMARWIDRAASRWPSLAADLLLVARKVA